MSNCHIPLRQPSKQKWRLKKLYLCKPFSLIKKPHPWCRAFQLLMLARIKEKSSKCHIHVPLPGGQNLSLALSFFHSLFPFPFRFHFPPPSPPLFPSMFQENSAQFKGSLLAWPAPWWSASSLQANVMMEHQRTIGISAPLHKQLSSAGQW